MRYVAQRGIADCGVAVVAMLADVPYDEALAAFDEPARAKIAERTGTNHIDLERALRAFGFVAFLAVRPEYGGTARRLWPPEPIGWQHVVSVRYHCGAYHWAAMDSAGHVYDPADPTVCQLAAYDEVRELTVIVRPTAPAG